MLLSVVVVAVVVLLPLLYLRFSFQMLVCVVTGPIKRVPESQALQNLQNIPQYEPSQQAPSPARTTHPSFSRLVFSSHTSASGLCSTWIFPT